MHCVKPIEDLAIRNSRGRARTPLRASPAASGVAALPLLNWSLKTRPNYHCQILNHQWPTGAPRSFRAPKRVCGPVTSGTR